jgi:hypothetical protein
MSICYVYCRYIVGSILGSMPSISSDAQRICRLLAIDNTRSYYHK